MAARIQVTFDAASPPTLGRFWAQVLGYVIEAGSDPYQSDLARVRIGNVTELTATLPRGTYFVRVRAVTGSGAGLPSNEVVIRR